MQKELKKKDDSIPAIEIHDMIARICLFCKTAPLTRSLPGTLSKSWIRFLNTSKNCTVLFSNREGQ